ncbi:DUF1997 domain-containing protein [Lusitaniella coriacea LEGE 07157]|uniref:DUF1997 domain-containing protein n=1 Tax=Lusitaniella coriacea LEGE 07157 TaxID=945747 RepID=A0A8J7IUQ5_9CYAN|nr:DUF1997 domain-containing protein [Lusitaniella coriacea]MBE9117827.1 DUF1997 domain-containing protein [Lusitaniella coriacea LEGE 07157]
MHSQIRNRKFEIFSEVESAFADAHLSAEQIETTTPVLFDFETHFQGGMGMYSDPQTVAEYLNDHDGWFCRCAQPMAAEPLGENGYTLIIGKFGSFGYEVEPKMGVVLLPPDCGVYNMHSIPVPGYTPPGYEVDYRASMQLAEIPSQEIDWGVKGKFKNTGFELPPVVTQVEWQLHLKVTVQFPKFIYKLPQSLIQTTGDRLLAQIVRQISPRLTLKVQKDFHARLGLPVPPKQSRHFSSTTRNREES